MKTQITDNSEVTIDTMVKGYDELEPSLLAMSIIRPGSRVLSAGCGAGREVDHLVNKLKCEVVAVDIDRRVLIMSEHKTPNAKYICGNIVDMKFEEKFDYVVCLWNTMNYLDKKAKKMFVETSYENLKEDGELIIATTHIFSHWRHFPCNIKHRKHFHHFPWEINGWFKDTKFKLSKVRIGATIVLFARK